MKNYAQKSGFLFSLKGKVLLGLSVLVAAVIAVNSYYSYDLFLSDKTNYIFENSLQKVEEISDSLVSPINQAVKKINPFILIASQGNDELEQILNSDERMRFFAYKKGEGEWKTFTRTKEDRDGIKRTESFIEWWQIMGQKSPFTNNILIKGLAFSDHYYVAIFFQQGTQKVSFLLDYTDLVQELQESNLFSYYLINDQGRPFFPREISYPSYVEKILADPIAKGVKQVSVGEEKEKEDYLVSFVKLPTLGFALISEISKQKAFSIAEDLIKKSAFFGLIVLGLALFLGLLFSLTVTRPIHSLMAATQHVAEGDFSKRVTIKSNDEFKILGNSFNFMSSEIQNMILQLEQANEQLEEYNKNLEKMVEERTAELKKANDFIATMINSLDQGLLVFDKELKVADIYTNACKELFGMELENKTYPEVLGMSEKEGHAIHKWANIVFSEKIPFSSASKLGPQNKVTGENPDDDEFKHVDLEYHPMKGEEGIENIVAVATDKTDEVRAIEASKKKEAYVEMILKLIHSKRQFYSFLDDVNDILENLKKELTKDDPSLDTLLINYHSLNGGFGTYSVYNLQKMARSCEQYIVDHRENTENPPNLNKMRSHYEDFIMEYQEFLGELEKIFGEKKETVEIDKALILYFSEVLEEKSDLETSLLFKEYFEKEAVEEHFEGYKELVQNLSMKLSKPISPLKIKNGDIRVNPNKTKEFFNVLVHLFRNCVDHGIESPGVRKERNKPEAGNITVAFNKARDKDHETLVVKVEDDGGGIDPERIRDKWKSMYPEDEDIDRLPDDEVIYKIFDPNFSTADAVTDVSGRGVGMSAIKEVIEKNGGSLEVLSQVGKGSSFEFRFPLS